VTAHRLFRRRDGLRTTPAYDGQMPVKPGLYRDEAQKRYEKIKQTVYIIKGGRLGGWRGYNDAEARANLEKYGGKLTTKIETVSREVK
jgi:hypothetical protein